MSAETLTEAVRVRLTPTLKAELETAAGREQRSAGAVARRAIELELERLRKTSKAEA